MGGWMRTQILLTSFEIVRWLLSLGPQSCILYVSIISMWKEQQQVGEPMRRKAFVTNEGQREREISKSESHFCDPAM